MKISNLNQPALSVCLALLSVSPASHAEIYKWVDANGRTHYSERRDDPGRAKAVELKVTPQARPAQATSTPKEYWQEQERQFKQRQITKQDQEPNGPPVDTRPKSLSGGRSDGTDASRCKLAQDVISGAAKHYHGVPTDNYDREVAESDIRTFCH